MWTGFSVVEQYIPREHQKIVTKHLTTHYRAAAWVKMGMGKSAAVLDALDQLSLVEAPLPALVIAPLRVVQSVWPEEVKKWAQFNKFKVSVVLGSKEERERALRVKADIYCVNFENLSWLVNLYEKNWPFKTIIVDEASKLRGFRLRQGTARARDLAKVAFKSERFIELTGSPAPNGAKNLWGQLWFLDKGLRLGRTHTAFMERWFKLGYDGYSVEPLPNAQKEIEAKVKDLCLSIDDSYFPVDAPIKTVIPVQLPSSAMAQYKKMEKDFFAELGKHQVEAFNAAAKTTKLLQFASGAVYYEGGNWAEAHRVKIDALESIIEEANGASVLVAYHFVSDLERLLKTFPQGRVLDKDPQTIKDWNEGKIPVLFAHPASAGHGLNLQHGSNILVYFGCTWDMEIHEQILERIGPARQKQAGYNRPVFVYYILAEGTIDFDVHERLESKKSVQEILIAALARRT